MKDFSLRETEGCLRTRPGGLDDEPQKRMRRIILSQARRAGVGHIGSCLSVVDLVWALYGHVLEIPTARHPDRDRFVLSKGHAALALYAALFLKGYITEDRLNTFCADGSSLGVHPEIVLEWVDFATGSLGHGLSYGVGAALAARLQKSSRRTFVLISDAECNEGAVWEALMFAGHHRLANLTVIVDINGQQAMGYTREVLDLAPLAEKFRAFGWDAHEIDGHNVSEILQALQSLEYSQGAPHVILARTTFGKGVSFMENQIRWHYLPLTDELFQRAMAEVDSL